MTRLSPSRRRLMSALGGAVFGLAMVSASAARAEGYWAFAGYTTKPPQAQLDAVKPGPGRVFEQKVSGAFQPALSGAGTVELFLKSDDADRRVFLSTASFAFTTGVDMRALTPGQMLKIKATLSMGGNELSKGLPASGTGRIAIDNGDYVVALDTRIDQPASGAGEVRIPGGGPGGTMLIYATGHIGSYGGLTGTLEMNYVWKVGSVPAAP